MKTEYADVLVVGAGSAGLYFAGRMAEQGLRVIVCEADTEEALGSRYAVIHIARKHFEEFGLPEPVPGDDVYIRSFVRSIQRSALNNWPKNSYSEILVLHRAPLMRSLLNWTLERIAGAAAGAATGAGAGATAAAGAGGVHFETRFEAPLFDDDGRLAGGQFVTRDGEHFEVRARLTVDASGIDAVVRTALPADYGMENFVTGPRDQFYVVLRYATLADPVRDKITVTTTWTHYKVWLASQVTGDGAIIGIGANLSYDYAEHIYAQFAELGYLPEHTVDYFERSSTPYRRPPYTLVADGFIALGDAACITNPWTGEGVPYAWLECSVAAPVAAAALAEGAYPTQAALWRINRAYAEAQGALFAKNLAMLSGATQCTPEENDYEYQKGIIYEDHNEQGDSLEKGSLVGKLLAAFLTRHISLDSLGKLMDASTAGTKIEKHYLAFPLSYDAATFAAWCSKADALWEKAGSMADVAEAEMRALAEEE